MTNAPLVVGDVVITGISGGEFGVRGRVTAFDAVDGHELWRGYSTGPDNEVDDHGDTPTPTTRRSRARTSASRPGRATSGSGAAARPGAGTRYDPELNLFYYGSGNPGTWNPDQRPGDNKWSMTIWARNPQTGR